MKLLTLFRSWIILFGVMLPFLSLGATGSRDLAVKPRTGATQQAEVRGEYWALIIGIDKYQSAPPLESAVKDALGVRDVLAERYGFEPQRTIELLDEEATRTNVEDALYRLGRQADVEDSVLIYYAGHGQYDEEGSLGWWVPVDGDPKRPGTFITNASIRDYLKGMKARHVYLVADSCFSGTLFGTRALPPITDQWYSRLYTKRSRWGAAPSQAPITDSRSLDDKGSCIEL